MLCYECRMLFVGSTYIKKHRLQQQCFLTFNHSFTAFAVIPIRQPDVYKTLLALSKFSRGIIEPERPAVVRCGPVLTQCLLVFPGAVTFIARPLVLGMLGM